MDGPEDTFFLGSSKGYRDFKAFLVLAFIVNSLFVLPCALLPIGFGGGGVLFVLAAGI